MATLSVLTLGPSPPKLLLATSTGHASVPTAVLVGSNRVNNSTLGSLKEETPSPNNTTTTLYVTTATTNGSPNGKKVLFGLENNNIVTSSSANNNNNIHHNNNLTTLAEAAAYTGVTRIIAANSNNSNTNSTAPTTTTSADMLRCKRRISFTSLGGYGVAHAPPAAVARRNARERNRVKQVNLGFSSLRQHIPSAARAKKMSKVETLRRAVDYIRDLQRLLDDNEASSPTEHDSTSPTSSAGSGTYHHIGSTNNVENSRFYYSSSRSQGGLSPPCSDDTASSPTPSYASEGSSYVTNTMYENYENCEPMSPEAEEDLLLDAIAWWQQSQ